MGNSLIFSLQDYQDGLEKGLFRPPEALCPFYQTDPILYNNLSIKEKRRNNLDTAIEELRRRLTQTYFRNTYPLQMRTLGYSTNTFPAYRFILPEVMTEDWLAIVDWGRFQRDHILHQPLCGYILLKLLGEGVDDPLRLPSGYTILESCVDSILRWEGTGYLLDFLMQCGMPTKQIQLLNNNSTTHSVWRAFFKEAAYVAAIFHDLGYPWQYAKFVQGNLDGINTPFIKENRNSEQILSLFAHRLLCQVLNGYQKLDPASPSTWRQQVLEITEAALINTHGLPGALGFLHLNDCVRRYPNSNQSAFHLLCVEWVAVAILMHDMKKIYWGERKDPLDIPQNPFLRISFERDPLSAIVALVDVIQEFERPTVSYGVNGNSVTLDYGTACKQTEIDIDQHGTLTIRYKMESREALATKLKYQAIDQVEYFDTQYGFLDMKGLGINNVQLKAYT